jgi:predicted AAA+ superfamily ATPase
LYPRQRASAGFLWEHLVLDELRFDFSLRQIHYWRDKSGREIDFVIDRGANNIDLYEAKYQPNSFEPKHIQHFRTHYPLGNNYVISPFIRKPYQERLGSITITYTSRPLRSDDRI